MNKIVLLIFILTTAFCKAQYFHKVDTLDFPLKNYMLKEITFLSDGSKSDFYSQHYFNNLGQHERTISFYKKHDVEKIEFKYKEDKLIAIINSRFKSHFNDSIEHYYNTHLLPDSLLLAYSEIISKFEDVDPENLKPSQYEEINSITQIQYNQLEKDSVVLIFQNSYDKEMQLTTVIKFTYLGQQIKSVMREDLPLENTISFQAFKSNSYKFVDNIRLHKSEIQEMHYNYFSDTVVIKYKLSGKTKSKEIIVHNSFNNQTISNVITPANDTILSIIEIFDEKSRRVSWHRTTQKNVNPFGYSIDIGAADKKIFNYDEKSNLLKVNTYYGEKFARKTIYK